MASIASLYGSSRGEDRAGHFRGGGSAAPRAWRTVRRCTPCPRANSRIDISSTRASRRIAANNSTRDPIPTPPVLENHRMEPRLKRGQIKPLQTPRRVARGARTSRHGGASSTCHSHRVLAVDHRARSCLLRSCRNLRPDTPSTTTQRRRPEIRRIAGPALNDADALRTEARPVALNLRCDATSHRPGRRSGPSPGPRSGGKAAPLGHP